MTAGTAGALSAVRLSPSSGFVVTTVVPPVPSAASGVSVGPWTVCI